MTSRFVRLLISADVAVARVYRSDWGRLLSLLVARTRRLDLAEDALSEAFSRANSDWRNKGVPSNPQGWLFTTASRIIITQLRAEAIHRKKAQLLAVRADWIPAASDSEAAGLGDERLSLVLLCCHPALRPEVRSALALRLVIGTSTEEIARLFLVSTSTMAARITRGKKRIVSAGIPLASPVDDELRDRLDDVCRTVYLAFTAGYSPTQGPDLHRTELASEAVELAELLTRLVPKAPQVKALFGLLLLQHARRKARIDGGKLVTLANQDRSLWDQDQLQKGNTVIRDLPVTEGYGEELRLQGAIAAQHVRGLSAADTDWARIAMLYGQLEVVTGSPIVRLNRAVAVAEVSGPQAGLQLTTGLEERLPGNHRLHAVRADLARRAGNTDLARSSYRQAIELCQNEVEREFLEEQLEKTNYGLRTNN